LSGDGLSFIRERACDQVSRWHQYATSHIRSTGNRLIVVIAGAARRDAIVL
jgi:hypothetical protein